jgi:hypothetical protein
VRTRWRGTALLVLVLAACRPAASAGDDYSETIGPARIGASLERLSAALPMRCDAFTPTRKCTLLEGRFAGVPVSGVEAAFRDGQLAQVKVRLDTRHYPALLEALRARLGEPEDRTFRARAGMAGELEAGVKLWTSGEVSSVLEQYAGKIDRAALTFGDAGAMHSILAEKRSYAPGTWRDL